MYQRNVLTVALITLAANTTAFLYISESNLVLIRLLSSSFTLGLGVILGYFFFDDSKKLAKLQKKISELEAFVLNSKLDTAKASDELLWFEAIQYRFAEISDYRSKIDSERLPSTRATDKETI